MNIEHVQCDCCGALSRPGMRWDMQFSVFSLKLPLDGINGGDWNMDICPDCRFQLHHAIREKVQQLRAKEVVK